MLVRVLCLIAISAAPARADDGVLDRWLVRQQSIRSLEVGFTQTRTLRALNKPVITRGRLAFRKPGMVRWELGDPPATLAISDGATITLIDRKAKTARRVPADSPRAARFTLLAGRGFESPDQFKRVFEVADRRTDKGIEQFTLKPLDRSLRNQVPWVFLSIDPRTNLLVALELELKDKSRIRSVFGKPEINGDPDPSLFTADLTGLTVR